MGGKVNFQRKIPLSTKSVLSAVKKVTLSLIVQTRKMTRTRRTKKDDDKKKKMFIKRKKNDQAYFVEWDSDASYDDDDDKPSKGVAGSCFTLLHATLPCGKRW